jgi:hypothetical protein
LFKIFRLSRLNYLHHLVAHLSKGRLPVGTVLAIPAVFAVGHQVTSFDRALAFSFENAKLKGGAAPDAAVLIGTELQGVAKTLLPSLVCGKVHAPDPRQGPLPDKCLLLLYALLKFVHRPETKKKTNQATKG